VVAGIIFVTSWLRFPNFLGGCVDYIERPYYGLTKRYAPRVSDSLRIIHITDFPAGANAETERLNWRPRHARLLSGLVKARARVVAFDLAFGDDSEFDGPLIEAIKTAGLTRVVLGYERDGRVASGFSRLPVAFGRLEIGETTIGNEQALPRYAVLSHGRAENTLSLEPTLALQVKLASESSQAGREIRIVPDRAGRRLVLRDGTRDLDAIPSRVTFDNEDANRVLHATVLLQYLTKDDIQAISRAYSTVESWLDSPSDTNPTSESNKSGARNLEDYRDKVVIVGPDLESDQFGEPPNTVYGYSINAAVISALLRRLYPRELSLPAQFILLWLLALAAGVARAFIPSGDRAVNVPFLGREMNVPITLIAAVLVFVAVAVRLFSSQVLLDPVYNVAAIIAGYYVSGPLLAKWPVVAGVRSPRPTKTSSSSLPKGRNKEAR
jgi:CHASE2 domain-containing sensor protein